MIEFYDVAHALLEAHKRGESVALTSIVRIRGSSPRHNGARMLVWSDGRITGTVGGGTMEWRVIEDARAALTENKSRLEKYIFDTNSNRPDSVGLCGGVVDVFIDVNMDKFAEIARASLEALENDESIALASIIRKDKLTPEHNGSYLLSWANGRKLGSLEEKDLEQNVLENAAIALAEQKPRFYSYDIENGNNTDPESVVVHMDVLKPVDTLLILGAGHVAKPLARMGSLLGLRVCVVDDREEWANAERFPTADQISVIGYEPVNEILDPIPVSMTPSTYVVIATWGYDLPVMEQALEQDPGYIGLVSSPTKARVLFKRLQQSGYSDEAIQKIKAPIGLDIGSESPAEISIAILAEIMADIRGKSTRPLTEVRGAQVQSLFSSQKDQKKMVERQEEV